MSNTDNGYSPNRNFSGNELLDRLMDGPYRANPAYNPKTKKGSTQPQYIVDTSVGDLNRGVGTEIAQAKHDIGYSARESGRDLDRIYKDMDMGITFSPDDTEEQLNRARAAKQTKLEKLGNAVVQAGLNEFAIGTVKGISDLVDAIINIGHKPGTNDYTNPLSSLLESWQDTIKDKFEIYRRDPNKSFDIGDFGWWADNAVSVASTASIMIPVAGVARAVSLLGKLSKVARLSRGASRGIAKLYKSMAHSSRSVERLSKTINAGTKITANAVMSRTIENYQEARGVYKELYDDTLQQIKDLSDEDREQLIRNNPDLADKSDEEMAQYISGRGADETYKNDFAMLLMDVAQYKALGSIWKGLSKKTPSGALRVQNKQAYRELGKKVSQETTDAAKEKVSNSNFLKKRIDIIKENWRNPLTTIGGIEWSEGIEEMYQGIQTEKGKEVANMILDPNYRPRTIQSYLSDGAIWEQGFWGVLGGVAFQKMGAGLGNLKNKIKNYRDYKAGKISEEDYKKGLTADEKMRSAEIDGRRALLQKYVDDMEMINNFQNPDEFVRDEVTGRDKIVDGVKVNTTLTKEQAELKKAQKTSDFITAMTSNAIDAGNYDLLHEYVTSKEFEEYFKENGLSTTGDTAFQQQMIDKMESVNNLYSTNLYNVLRNTEVESYDVARIAARELTREQLQIDDLTEQSNAVQDQIDRLNNTNIDLSAYRSNATFDYVKEKIKELQEYESDLIDDYKRGAISKQAYNLYKRDFSVRRKQLLGMLANDSTTGDSNNIREQLDRLHTLLTDDSLRSDETMGEIVQLWKDLNDAVYKDKDVADTTPQALKELIDRQIGIRDSIENIESFKPKTQQDYVERMEDVQQQHDLLFQKRVRDAASKVEDYIRSQDDLKKAYDDVMKDRVDELKDEMELLKLGYTNRQYLSQSILATIKEEEQRRVKEEQEKQRVEVNGREVTPERAAEIRQEMAAQNEDQQEETQQPQQPQQPTSTEKNNTEPQQESQEPTQEPIEEAPQPTSEFDSREARDAARAAASYELSIDEMAVSRASLAAFKLFQVSRNLFDNALGKDVNSEEVEKLINVVADELEKQGVSVNYSYEAAKKGVMLALRTISRRLEAHNDSAASSFLALADSIATKQDMTQGMAAVTTSLNDLDAVITKFLDKYVELKKLKPNKKCATVINVNQLFYDLLNDRTLMDNGTFTLDDAMHLLYNMKDYLSNQFNSKYAFTFTSKRSINEILKRPDLFFQNLRNVTNETEELEQSMHINPPTQLSDEQKKAISDLQPGDEITCEFGTDRNGDPVDTSISFKRNGVEIGYISTVIPNSTNTGFTIPVNKYRGGIAYRVSRDTNGKITSNTDELFEAIITDERLKSCVDIAYANEVSGRYTTITKEDADYFMNHPAIKKAVENGVIVLPKKYVASENTVTDKYVNNVQKAHFIANLMQGVVMYDRQSSKNNDKMIDSYHDWIDNVFRNYENTFRIQSELKKGLSVSTKYSSFWFDGAMENIILDEEQSIDKLGFTSDRNKIIGVSNGSVMAEGTGNTGKTTHLPNDVMGFAIGKGNYIATFTSGNGIKNDTIKTALRKEIQSLLEEYLNSNDNTAYNTLRDKLSKLLGSKNSIFGNYYVISNSESIAICSNGEYKMVIYASQKKDDSSKGGIVYNMNGKRIKITDKNIESAVQDIVENVKYKPTMFPIENSKIDNTDSNNYLYKENGKLVLSIGGEKIVYDNFGDFVLKEAAFNTRQGRDENGDYFDMESKITSLYVDTSLIRNNAVTEAQEEQYSQSVEDTIKKAGKESSVAELLYRANVDQQVVDVLTGDNSYGIELLPKTYGFDPRLTKENAVYRKGRIYFSKVGAKYVGQSTNSLVRILMHENLHHIIEQQDLFSRQGIVEDLMDVYEEAVEAVNRIINDKNADPTLQKQATVINEWLKKNKFNITDYFKNFSKSKQAQYAKMSEAERQRIFAEEWLVETLTQPAIMNFLNNVESKDRVEVQKEKKSLFQKIIDILLKLFGKTDVDIKENSILAKEYQILGNLNNNQRENSDLNLFNYNDYTPENTSTPQEDQSSDAVNQEDTTSNGKEAEAEQDASSDDLEMDIIDDDSQEDDTDIDTDIDSIDFSSVTSATDDIVIDGLGNDGNVTAKTFGITRITTMNDYLGMYPVQDRAMIQKMLDDGTMRYACR